MQHQVALLSFEWDSSSEHQRMTTQHSLYGGREVRRVMSLDHMYHGSFSPSYSTVLTCADRFQGGGSAMVNLGRNLVDYFVLIQGTGCSDVEVSYLKSCLSFRSKVVVDGVPSFYEASDLT